jgi:hypothetical protein
MKVVLKNHRISAQIVEARYEKIIRDYPALVSDSSKQSTPMFDSYMSFYRWDNNSIVRYGEFHDGYTDLIQDIVFNQNKQYQWNLVVAFEAYEKYLKNAISLIISLKNQNKINVKFETKIFRAVLEQDIKEINESLQKKQGASATKILIELRHLLPNYALNEKNNTRETNMCFMIALIERMRHHIVHTNGIVLDRNGFTESIVKNIGIFNNGKYDSKYISIVNEYFIMQKYPNEISLLEIPVLDLGSIIAKSDILDNLFQILLNSAYFICEEIVNEYKQEA